MAHKGSGDRGLFQRPKGSGTWWIRYFDRDHRKHEEKGGNKGEARALLEQRKTEVRLGAWRPSSKANRGEWGKLLIGKSVETTTLGEFALRWLDERTAHLTQQVEYNYRMLLRSHLLPHRLARLPLDQIDDGDIAALVKELRTNAQTGGRPLSAGRVNELLKRLGSIFRVAQRRKLIAVNPMDYVDKLREAKPEIDPMGVDEAVRVIEAAQGWERAFLAVLLFTGMRPGEALALTWNNVDFDHGLIRVRRTLHRRFGFGLPKTPGSERDIDMGEAVRAELMHQRARSQMRGELVFPSEVGTPMDLQNFRLRNWPRILRRAKVRPRVLYQCRHTFVRLALEHGDSPQHIAAMLGHVSTEMIFKRYGRWMERPQSAAMARLDATLAASFGRSFGRSSTLKMAEKR
jgi:integrase